MLQVPGIRLCALQGALQCRGRCAEGIRKQAHSGRQGAAGTVNSFAGCFWRRIAHLMPGLQLLPSIQRKQVAVLGSVICL